MILRISLCLLLTAAFVSDAFAQRHTDVQSLQYEFGRNIRAATPTTPAIAPCSCEKPVVYAPVARGCCYSPCYKSCCYPAPVMPRYYPVKYRRAFVRPVYYPPYCW